MASIFKNKFFSAAGQKERLTNVAQTLSVAVTGKTLQGEKDKIVTSSGKSNILTAAANHPFITAGVATAGIYAAGAVAGSASSGSAAAAAGSTAAKTALTTKAASIGSVGLVGLGAAAGAILAGAGKQTTDQTTNPQQITTPSQSTPTTVTPTVNPDQGGDIITPGNYNRIYANRTTTSNISTETYNYPSQETTPTQSVSQAATQSQEGSWIIPAAIIGAAFILSK